MNAGSLFSGVGGLDLGLHRAGITHRFFCESDPWRRTVLAHHWPGVPVYDDVRTVGKPAGRAPTDGHSPPVDGGGWEAGTGLLCGGFPCQDLSVAGNRAGLAGGRSGLFFEFARIIDALRPRWVLLENVPGLLSSNSGRDFGIVLGTLADIGYGLGWRTVDSRFFGVPQRRRRVFILGALADDDPRVAAERAGQVLAVGTRCDRHPPAGTQTGEDVAGTIGNGARGSGGGSRSTDLDGHGAYVANPLGSSPRPGREQGGPRGDLDNDTYVPGTVGVRRLTPTECERLQGWPDGWTNPDGRSPDSRRYAAAGDGVTASVGEWIGRRLMAA